MAESNRRTLYVGAIFCVPGEEPKREPEEKWFFVIAPVRKPAMAYQISFPNFFDILNSSVGRK